MRLRCREAVQQGWTHFKLKVGADAKDDLRRARLIRAEIGTSNTLMLDANQYWDFQEAIAAMQKFAEVHPWWIEEPTSPDDVLGHATIARAIAPIRVAIGEHIQNRILFKQLLQTKAIGFCLAPPRSSGYRKSGFLMRQRDSKAVRPAMPHQQSEPCVAYS